MWLVRLALRRPYTFTIMAMLIVLLRIVTIARMSTDIFPRINIPVVSVIWSFSGVAPEEMAARFVTVTERAMTTTVNDIEHIESQSYSGVAVIKVFFHEGAKAEAGVAQISSICETLLRILPPGTTPPLILQYSASNVPVLQLGLTGEGLSEQQLYDLGLNFIRTQLSTVQGAQVPLPYGGKVRQVMVDIDLQKLYAKGLSPADVTTALTAQNLILPAGTQKIGDREYYVRLNSSPRMLEALNDLPVKQVGNATITMRDVAEVRDGFAVQTNIVSQNGTRAALLTVLKSANASTLDIIKRVREALPRIEATLPPALKITELFDQSLFVRAAIDGVLKEGLIAACLTALMILLFLGSWRSTLVVAVSIPLAIFSSIILLGALGQTLNIMTLGGLALAVGILVDDATVEIENIHRNLGMGKPMTSAILDGARQVAVPAFVSTLCICIVFVPVFFLGGTAKFLFQPLAMGVIFAMLASYFLSRTVVPTMARFLLRHHLDEIEMPDGGKPEGSPENPRRQSRFAGVFGWLRGIHDRFNHGFGKLREAYVAALDRALDHRGIVFLSMGGLVLVSARPRAVSRAGFLSRGGCGPVPPALPGARRHAARGDRGALQCGRQGHSRGGAGRRGAHRAREHRPARQRHQSRLQRQFHHQFRRRRNPRGAQPGASRSHGELCAHAQGKAPTRFSGHGVLLFGSGYREPDSELRPARAHRYPDHRSQPRKPCPGQADRGQGGANPRSGRRPFATAGARSRAARQR